MINRIQEIDQSCSWRTYQPIFFKTEDKEFEIYKNKINLLNPNDLKLWKINQAIPSLEMEINGKNNPLELGLQDLIAGLLYTSPSPRDRTRSRMPSSA